MNQVLSLKGQFEHQKNHSRPGAPQLPANAEVNSKDLVNIKQDLEEVRNYWQDQTKVGSGNKILLCVYYERVIPKSKRIQALLGGKDELNQLIVGAKFETIKGTRQKRHIITYCIPEENLESSIENLEKVIQILNEYFDGQVTSKTFNKSDVINHQINFDQYGISKSKFQRLVVDVNSVEKIQVKKDFAVRSDENIVTLYNTGISMEEQLSKYGITVKTLNKLDDFTLQLTRGELQKLKREAPFLVAMAMQDFADLQIGDPGLGEPTGNTIVDPSDEPVIGVLDTAFNQDVYFNKWVDYTSLLGEYEDKGAGHGTEVDSIIVDGPVLNPNLDDGCGHFRVKHYGVADSKRTNVLSLIDRIRRAVEDSPEIHVWNLSLGSNWSVDENFISLLGAELDRLQAERNIIFVVCATNGKSEKNRDRIGAPADSINSLVVSSVKRDGTPAKYSREGIVLSFFVKPDVAYYGGDEAEPLGVFGKSNTTDYGTSFAAPWIARKLAYLIEVMGLSREVAKALIIDAAAGWQELPQNSKLIGNGVVPIKIQDILETPSDEIRFVIRETAKSWNTYNYNLPVPQKDGKFPFFARATLCYFPPCNRQQGVDYTETELDLYFGRVDPNNGHIKPINSNRQTGATPDYMSEEDARMWFRKWDNVKRITETISKNARARKVFGPGMWGMNIKSKQRLGTNQKELTFGLVVTFKEMNGENRIEDFIQMLNLRGWIVSRIDVEERLKIYNQGQIEIEWE